MATKYEELRDRHDKLELAVEKLINNLAKSSTERNEWIRRFNRLEAAISHHIGAKAEAFKDEADEALHKAHKQIMKDLAK